MSSSEPPDRTGKKARVKLFTTVLLRPGATARGKALGVSYAYMRPTTRTPRSPNRRGLPFGSPADPGYSSAMNTEAENLVLEHLRAVRAKLDKIDNDLGDLRQRVSSIEHHLVNMQRDIVNIHERLDHQGERLDRIERRLELTESPA